MTLAAWPSRPTLQVMSPTQPARQDGHCGWWREAHQRSRPRQYLWLLKKHTRGSVFLQCVKPLSKGRDLSWLEPKWPWAKMAKAWACRAELRSQMGKRQELMASRLRFPSPLLGELCRKSKKAFDMIYIGQTRGHKWNCRMWKEGKGIVVTSIL